MHIADHGAANNHEVMSPSTTTSSPAPTTNSMDHYEDEHRSVRRWGFYYPRHIPAPLPFLGARERLLSLTMHSAPSLEQSPNSTIVETIAATPLPSQNQTSQSQNNLSSTAYHQRKQTVAETHRSNIRQRLEYRLTIARLRNDHALVQLLEDEYKQFA